ncbi:aldo/keto reductase [Ktedonobacter sp. SOSP1-52]|uniref:aldo/keto reductase n=1 Tax=Ktedonobacter sp. SOSP1-52 TaxID=2778366 RepID=UPI00191565F2|nr:aldo/keto reductase [Ktedonobacter sp. SOSP1-52]GHO70591.1 aldo/keto reductase [Ktedonobacter sp. SOSP1-52]
MQTHQFGKTDMRITAIGLGTWALGGNQWGPQDDQESIATIQRALDLGINWIDTAAIYGLGGSEKVVGRAIKGRKQPYIFTKCSLIWDEGMQVSSSLKASSIRHEVEESLRRLDIETIDLYQIHWPNPDPEIEEGWNTLAELKREGKVRHIGVSNFNVAQLQRAEKIAPVETLQPPYSLINRQAEHEILPYCQQNTIGTIVYSPMASGLLSGHMTRERIAQLPDGDWRKQGQEFQEPRLTRNLALADLLTAIGKARNVTAGTVAIAWALHNPAVTAAIVGVRHPYQADELAIVADFHLSEAEYQQIEQFSV